MTIGIGVDLVSIERIESALAKSGARFVDRILSEEEKVSYGVSKDSVNFLAKRFAAKEAVAKALGTGISNGLRWTDISTQHDSLGRPGVILTGEARKKMQALGGKKVLLSLADEAGMVVAVAQLV